MTKTKTTIDISSFQDFVLNERNIETILKHISTKPIITKKSVIKTQNKIKPVSIDFLLPKFSDHGDGYKDSLEQKIDLVYKVRENKELLKKNKWKKNAIEDELVNHKEISLMAFMCICAIEKFNIVYIDNRKIYTSSNLNIVEKTQKGYALFLGDNEQKYKKYRESIDKYWHIESINKPLRGISSYKVKELQEICKKLGLDILNDKKTKKPKKILYQMIQEHL
jgi:hypothetical protein